MARTIHPAHVSTPAVELTAAQRREAARLLQERQVAHRLRRVRLGCCMSWMTDPSALVGDWLWCETDGDLGRVVELAE